MSLMNVSFISSVTKMRKVFGQYTEIPQDP